MVFDGVKGFGLIQPDGRVGQWSRSMTLKSGHQFQNELLTEALLDRVPYLTSEQPFQARATVLEILSYQNRSARD